MSRHEFSFVHEDKRYDMAIGWDVPLQSYFATVYDYERQEDDWIIFMCGANALTPITDVQALLDEMPEFGRYVDMPLCRKLTNDWETSPQPTPHQKTELNTLKGLPDPTVAEADAALREHQDFHAKAPNPDCTYCKAIIADLMDDPTYSDYVARKMAGELD